MPSSACPLSPASDRVAAVRRFNRFYTGRIGALREGLLDSEFTLTESRLLWELAQRPRVTATELARSLHLDSGYLSRLLAGLKQRGLLRSEPAAGDARQRHLRLSTAGERAFAPLNARSHAEVTGLLAPLSEAQQQQLLRSMAVIEQLLPMPGAAPPAPPRLRPHRAGDIGWVVSRHGALYAAEYGWDLSFEALVARIAADFVERFDARREACWIAEHDGAPVGCAFLVQDRDDTTQAPVEATARLRMVLVEPSVRGQGLGLRLVQACEDFARQAGYRRIVLWTHSNLLAARAIYRRCGYALTGSDAYHAFGHDLVAETWELALS